MTFAQFDSTKTSLEDLLKAARDGKLQLPDFQRGWVWDDEGIRSLLASISQSFPVGAIMTLQTGGDVRFRPRPIEGAETKAEPEHLLLDGQQRITSLFQACFWGQVIETQNAQRRRIKRWYYIDMADALDNTTDRELAITGVPEDKIITTNFGRDVVLNLSTPEKEFENCFFPLNKVFDSDDWQLGFFEYWNHDADKSRFWFAFQNKIIQRIKQYQVPVISLSKGTPKEAVCLIFEKVNTGGKKLDAFELLTAIYAADDFNLRDDWLGERNNAEKPGRLTRLGKSEVLREVASTDFLQAVSLLHTLEKRRQDVADGKGGKQLSQVTCTRQSILNLPLAAYKKWADAATEGFEKAAKFLSMEKVFWRTDIPYNTQIVPLAATLALIGDKWETDVVRQMIRKWYWCGVFGELYGSAVETRFANDLLEVPAWLDGGPKPRTIEESNFAADRLYTLRTRLSAAYKGIHALLMRQGGHDFKTGQPYEFASYWDEAVDIHHIFPRNWCEKVGDIPRERYDCVVNKTPIARSTNRIIGGNAPSAYLSKLQAEYGMPEGRMDEILESHWIDPVTLRADDFDGFFKLREEKLLELIEGATGKRVARNVEPDEPMEEPVDDAEDELAA